MGFLPATLCNKPLIETDLRLEEISAALPTGHITTPLEQLRSAQDEFHRMLRNAHDCLIDCVEHYFLPFLDGPISHDLITTAHCPVAVMNGFKPTISRATRFEPDDEIYVRTIVKDPLLDLAQLHAPTCPHCSLTVRRYGSTEHHRHQGSFHRFVSGEYAEIFSRYERARERLQRTQGLLSYKRSQFKIASELETKEAQLRSEVASIHAEIRTCSRADPHPIQAITARLKSPDSISRKFQYEAIRRNLRNPAAFKERQFVDILGVRMFLKDNVRHSRSIVSSIVDPLHALGAQIIQDMKSDRKHRALHLDVGFDSKMMEIQVLRWRDYEAHVRSKAAYRNRQQQLWDQGRYEGLPVDALAEYADHIFSVRGDPPTYKST